MQYHGFFWSAVIRALLSLRRDNGLDNEYDTTMLESVTQIENEKMDDDGLASILHSLCPANEYETIGRSLIGYFDFNKMSNLVVYLTASKHIDDALHVLGKHYHYILGNSAALTVKTDGNETCLRFQPSSHPVLTEFRCYFLLALCRHLAGRKFDFTTVTLPPSGEQPVSLLRPVSSGDIRHEGVVVCLVFDNKWCKQASFYYSQSIKKMLAGNLDTSNDLPLKQQVKEAFLKAPSPARIRSEWVATQLGQTESAFRRQLRQESISFSALLKEYIHDQSCHRLLSGEKTEDTAAHLGFSDRRSFERSFKEHAGISAGQLRQLGNRLRFQKGNGNLINVVEDLPPLPNSIQTLLNMDCETMTLADVVSLIEKDPIFQAHVMSKASRAVYGSVPKNLEQAIGRNLGLGNIRNLAVIFAAQQLLTSQCRFEKVNLLTDAMLLSLTIFQRLFGFNRLNEDQTEQVKQLLLFGTLSLFLIFHDECLFSDGAVTHWDESASFDVFLNRINDEYGVCLYGATSLMLLRWGFNSAVNQQLWKLCSNDENGNSDSLTGQITLCHTIAFNLLNSQETPEYSQDTLTKVQSEMLEEIVTSWRVSAA